MQILAQSPHTGPRRNSVLATPRREAEIVGHNKAKRNVRRKAKMTLKATDRRCIASPANSATPE